MPLKQETFLNPLKFTYLKKTPPPSALVHSGKRTHEPTRFIVASKKKTAQKSGLKRFIAASSYAFTLPFTLAITSSAMLFGAGA